MTRSLATEHLARVLMCSLCLVAGTACEARHDLAARHHAVAVIADFADAHLEDWTGPGVNSVADVQARLAAASADWSRLSHGRETLTWQIVRVQLDRPLADGAFANAAEVRDEVVRLARPQLRGHDKVDAFWIVAADRGHAPAFLAGGEDVLVDAQDASPLAAGSTAHLAHELARARGVPVLAPLGDLSIMASTFPAPPADFSAYERVQLGWVAPERVGPGCHRVVVPDASRQLAALEIPGANAGEYFLLEHRRRPTTGFDLVVGAAFDGVAIYHVREHAELPVALESARGLATANPAPGDLIFPDNAAMTLPRVLRAESGDEVARIDAVRARDDGSLVIDVCARVPRDVAARLAVNGHARGDRSEDLREP